MVQINRIMLGKGGCFLDECLEGGFIGADFEITEDLSDNLPEDWRAFNKKYIPVWIGKHPGKSNVSAGLSCGNLWTICKGLQKGAIVLTPNGNKEYHVGEVIGDYYYVEGQHLPHRRKVKWLDKKLSKQDFSEALVHSSGSIGTCCDISQYASEIETLINKEAPTKIIATSDDVEDPSEFALESHLEDFLVKNWDNLDIGKLYHIYQEDGDATGEQYETPVGRIDILAESNDKKTLLVLELKKGRTSDVVVGQTLRYMGYIQEMSPNQNVKGIIIGLNADDKLKYALKKVPDIEFYRYQIDFKLMKDC